jgi:hypothetical protein
VFSSPADGRLFESSAVVALADSCLCQLLGARNTFIPRSHRPDRAHYFACWYFLEISRTALSKATLATYKVGTVKFAGAMAVLVSVHTRFLIDRFGNYWPRLPPAVIRYASGRFDYDPILNSLTTLADARHGNYKVLGWNRSDGAVDLFVWGDSHAMAVLTVVGEALQGAFRACLCRDILRSLSMFRMEYTV